MLIVVKIGTDSVIGNIDKIAQDISGLKKHGHDVILVSSGAVGFGRSEIDLGSNPVEKQILASVGQVKLMLQYKAAFSKYDYKIGQILITKKDLEGKNEVANFELMTRKMLEIKSIVPIVNENDSVALSEIMFTDNDEIAGTLASFLGSDRLIILTNVDGVYDDFFSENRKILNEIELDSMPKLSSEKSKMGRGGMQSKVRIASKLAKIGISSTICNIKNDNVLTRLICDNERIGSTFLPSRSTKASSVKRKIAFDVGVKTFGSIVVNDCLLKKIKQENSVFSILPIGIESCSGDFHIGDLISIKDACGIDIGYGLARYSAIELNQKIGKEHEKPIIRYEQLYII
jgi:glutamate 5-kinase